MADLLTRDLLLKKQESEENLSRKKKKDLEKKKKGPGRRDLMRSARVWEQPSQRSRVRKGNQLVRNSPAISSSAAS